MSWPKSRKFSENNLFYLSNGMIDCSGLRAPQLRIRPRPCSISGVRAKINKKKAESLKNRELRGIRSHAHEKSAKKANTFSSHGILD